MGAVLALLALGSALYWKRHHAEEPAALCIAIAETQALALQPRDRIYWKEECVPLLRARERELAIAKMRAGVESPDGADDPHHHRGTVYAGPANGAAECIRAWDAAKRECVP